MTSIRFCFLVLFLWNALLLLLAGTVKADRRGVPASAAPFSTGEQALFGQSHCEDCLFGYSGSAFYVPPEEELSSTSSLDVVKQVKATSTTTMSSPSLEKTPAFGVVSPKKPAFVVDKKKP